MTISAAKQSQKPLFCLCTVPSRTVFLVPLSRSPYIIASIAASFAAINTLLLSILLLLTLLQIVVPLPLFFACFPVAFLLLVSLLKILFVCGMFACNSSLPLCIQIFQKYFVQYFHNNLCNGSFKCFILHFICLYNNPFFWVFVKALC